MKDEYDFSKSRRGLFHRPGATLTRLHRSEPGRPVTPEDLDWLAANRVGRLTPAEDAGTLLSRMRDEGECRGSDEAERFEEDKPE